MPCSKCLDLMLTIAIEYAYNKNATYASLSEKYGVSKRTIGRYFNEELEAINTALWSKVQYKKSLNKRKCLKNLVQMKKRTLIQKVLDIFKK